MNGSAAAALICWTTRLKPGGQFTASGAPSGTADCLQGNLCWALLELGYDDPRLAGAFDWMARTVTGEGIAPNSERNAAVRYYAGKCGPLFACGSNNTLPCAWGGVKVMQAFGKWPAERRTPVIERAIQQGVDFLLDTDPAEAKYPNRLQRQAQRQLVEVRLPCLLRHGHSPNRRGAGDVGIRRRSPLGSRSGLDPR